MSAIRRVSREACRVDCRMVADLRKENTRGERGGGVCGGRGTFARRGVPFDRPPVGEVDRRETFLGPARAAPRPIGVPSLWKSSSSVHNR